MSKPVVAISRYEQPRASVKNVVTRCDGLAHMPKGARVFIKPNVVFWSKAVEFPKWGVITTSRVVEDAVLLLKEHGIDDITIGEGMVARPTDKETPAHAFDRLGYTTLQQRYGVKVVNVLAQPFETVDLGDGYTLNFNTDILHSDFVVNLPVMKTHAQTMVSLGIKNLKGTIDMPSRKRCHNADPDMDLHHWVARLADNMPPMLTIIDGIYTNERGPGMDGRIRRHDVLVASSDVLAVDLVGSHILGHAPEDVPHLAMAARRRDRTTDLADIEVVGEPIEAVRLPLAHDHAYTHTEDGAWLPEPFAKAGVKGLSYPKYDTTMCTYCSQVNGLVLTAIWEAWKGAAWDDVEILTGKRMSPTPGMKKTVLLGKCIYRKHKDNPDIQEAIAVKGCPPAPEDICKALQKAGIPVDPAVFDAADTRPGLLMRRYRDKPEFDEALFRVA